VLAKSIRDGEPSQIFFSSIGQERILSLLASPVRVGA